MRLLVILSPKYLVHFDRRYLAHYERLMELQGSAFFLSNFRGLFVISLVSPAKTFVYTHQ